MLTKLCSRFQTASTLGGVCDCVVFFGGAPEPEPSVVSCGHPTVVVIGSSGGVLLLSVSSLSEQSLGSARALGRAPEPVKSHQSAWHTTDPIRSRSGDGCACPKSRSSSPTRVRDCKRAPTDRQTADGRVALPLAKRVQTKCCSQSRGR